MALAAICGAFVLLALSSPGALAQSSGDDASGAFKRYVMTATGTWGTAQDAAVLAAGGTVLYRHAASGIGIATSSDPGFLKRAMRSGQFGLSAEDRTVQWLEPANEQVYEGDLTEETITPGDETFINLQWSMTAIDAAGAWALGYNGAGVRVAVIDGGMCANHLDLVANIDAANSKSFVPGFNWFEDTGGPTSFRHACHVAGIIAAADNARGTIGVAPAATIISCKALHGGSGTFEAVIEAILYAADPISAGGGGADIINMSLGATFNMGGGNTGAGALVAATARAVNYATDHNVLVVVSAGNGGYDLDHTGNLAVVPAQSGSALAISATGPVGYAVGYPNGATNFRRPASYTNYGRSTIWVAAPGGDFVYPGNEACSIPRVPAGNVTTSCWVFDLVISPGAGTGTYFFAAGTSMSAPHASGVAALIKQKYPSISVGDLKGMLSRSADDEGETGTDPFYGHGFVNAHTAVTMPLAQQAASGPGRTETPAATRIELLIAGNGHSTPSISFALPAAGQARVDLFDVAGRKVAVLFDGPATAGRTTLAWDGRAANGERLRQGAYFARLTSGNVQAARQLVLLGQ
jgi:subtilisin family serine protease